MLVYSTFKRETHLPSAVKVWQQPGAWQLPMEPAWPPRSLPLEVQATSYLALSASMASFSSNSIPRLPLSGPVLLHKR